MQSVDQNTISECVASGTPTQTCYRCKIEKPLTDFHKGQRDCKDCRKNWVFKGKLEKNRLRSDIEKAFNKIIKETGVNYKDILHLDKRNRKTVKFLPISLSYTEAMSIDVPLINKVLSEIRGEDTKVKIFGEGKNIFDEDVSYMSCACCNEILPLDHFGNRVEKGKTHLKQSHCRVCAVEGWSLYRFTGSDAWFQELSPLDQKIYKTYKNAKGRYEREISGGKSPEECNKYKCELTLEQLKDLHRPEICPVSGLPILYKIYDKDNDSKDDYNRIASLDRINNFIGYRIDNVQWLSRVGNSKKGDKIEDPMHLIQSKYQSKDELKAYLENQLEKLNTE